MTYLLHREIVCPFAVRTVPCMTDLASSFEERDDLFGSHFESYYYRDFTDPMLREKVIDVTSAGDILVFNFSYIFGQPDIDVASKQWAEVVQNIVAHCEALLHE